MVEEINWRNLNASQLEEEYSPSSVIGGNYLPFIHEYIKRSDDVASSNSIIECFYGPMQSNSVDLILPENTPKDKPFPLLVFIHGGYWQELSKKESLFAAKDILSEGIAFAAVDYTLCPNVTIQAIVDECVMALRYLQSIGSKYNFDPNKIILAGSSAGAHLASMCVLEGMKAKNDSSLRIASTILVSGIYELEPIIQTSINDAIKMNRTVANSMSPMLKDLENFPDTLIVWGENETAEFKGQSNVFSKKLIEFGVNVKAFEVPSRNHFDVILDLTNRNTLLGYEFYKLIAKVKS